MGFIRRETAASRAELVELLAVRRAVGISATALAFQMRVKRNVLSMVERGRMGATPYQVTRYRTALIALLEHGRPLLERYPNGSVPQAAESDRALEPPQGVEPQAG